MPPASSNPGQGPVDECDDDDSISRHTGLEMEDFLTILAEEGDTIDVEAFVNISALWGTRERTASTRRLVADEVAKLIWDQIQYRFTYVPSPSRNPTR